MLKKKGARPDRTNSGPSFSQKKKKRGSTRQGHPGEGGVLSLIGLQRESSASWLCSFFRSLLEVSVGEFDVAHEGNDVEVLVFEHSVFRLVRDVQSGL